jgi:hypothetical protein
MRAIDLFAGAGGFSTGARMAGVDVVWADGRPVWEMDCREIFEAGGHQYGKA